MWDLLKYHDNIAVVDDSGNKVSYSELDRVGKELCSTISENNGDGTARCLVFSMCSNTLGSITGYISFLNGKIVPIMLKHDLDEEMLENLYYDYEPAYIWVADEGLKRPLFREMVSAYRAYGYNLLKTPFGKKTGLYPELALLLTTSGSTGSPKLVRQSYANIRANTDSIKTYLKLDSSERPITMLPMNYTYGISIINTHIDVGASILLTDKGIMQRDFWSFFRENGATSIAGVPYTYEMLKRLRFFSMNIPSLKTMTQAGGKLLPELHKEFAQYAKDTDRKFVVMYGACEATARMGWLPPEKSLEKQGSMGVAIPGGNFELIDIDGCVFDEPDKVGELVYYGENVTLGYAEKASDLIKGDEREGSYITGDMAQKDADGFYYIVGRKKRFLKIFGNRVNLDDCERLLKNAFDETDIACSGIDDKLYIFGTEGVDLGKMEKFLSEKTGLNTAAFVTIKLEEIPHNESGKIAYREFEKYFVNK